MKSMSAAPNCKNVIMQFRLTNSSDTHRSAKLAPWLVSGLAFRKLTVVNLSTETAYLPFITAVF